ncbi:hypothetical protein [Sphingobacterium populi]|nr:hypothetical protein [Sphingobacterium sp. CFCC 11742]
MKTREYAQVAIRVAAGFAVLYWGVSLYDWITSVYYGKNITPMYLANAQSLVP